MKLARLKSMGLTEIAYRSRQEASKWLERVAVNGRANGAASAPNGAHAAPAARRGPYFGKSAPRRFFEGAAAGATPALLREKMAGDCERTIAAAEQIRRGRFDLLGYRDLSFGDPVDWHFDPVSGRRSPLVHWSLLNPLDAETVGDHKVVWELNRQQWLIHLGVAYRLTGDVEYADAFAAYLTRWMRANPAGIGVNWASSLEAALRIVSWSWAVALFRDAEPLSPGLFAALVENIARHAAHVEKYLSYYFAPNTHLTGEALGLFYAGVVFPEFEAARRWRDLGARILIEQSARQIHADGVYFEQSTCYQRYTAEIYLHFLILAGRNRIAVPAEVGARVERAIDFLLALRRPDGTMPHIGDADGGWLAPLALRSADDCAGVFSLAAAFFGRPDYAWAAGGPAPETLWLLGPRGLKALAGLEPAPPRARAEVFFEGGYVVMRSGWSRDAHQLIFDAGPVNGPKSGHGHADLLSVQCSVFGEPYLVDPGTYCYTTEPEWRDYFRGSSAHNTATVDGLSQAAPAGYFGWQSRPRARLSRWMLTDAYDFADAAHEAYRGLADPVTHRRRVLFVKPRYWVIVDDFLGAAEHRVELRFQFAPLAVAAEANDWVRARGARGRALLVRPFAAAPLKMQILRGSAAPIAGWVSPDYGRRLAAPVLILSAAARLPLRVVTLLFPLDDPSDPCPAVSPISARGGAPEGLVFRREKERVVIHDDAVALEPE